MNDTYEIKEKEEIFNCEEGTKIKLYLKNKEVYNGTLKTITENEEIVLESLGSSYSIGIKYEWISYYYEMSTTC
tara:strand:+ start:314 stop:535 length:222 start_codon:yes stop_codon:yes gene_type:complete